MPKLAIITPLIYKGVSYPDYGIDRNTGKVLSKKRGGWRFKASSVSGTSPYPKTNLSLGTVYQYKTIMVHRAVCETLFECPIPRGITKKDWKITPKSVKAFVSASMEVNHIDHDHKNFHPSNIEWKSADENVEAYQAYRTG